MTDERSAVDDDASLNEWRSRPWALALLLGLAAALVHFASDGGEQVPWRMAITAALVFGSLACAVTLSPERWKSSTLFAGGVALVMAGIAWRATSAGDRYADEGFWVAAGLLAVTLSVPLFQAGFHRHRWATSYKATHFHVWTDAITAAGALAFVGLSWALIAILAELFNAIRIELLKDLIEEELFGWVYSGVTFGAALGVLRNQLKIIGTLQNVVLLVLSILAVPLAVALVLFLLAVTLSGLDVLWEATRSATPLLLAIAVGCFVLANSVVRDDDEDASHSRVLRVAGFVLALGILPLSVMAALSMGTRIAQHGLSPERLWAIVSIAVAVAYGVAYFVSAIRGWKTLLEGGWRTHLRQSNLHLAVLTCGVALVLAMPIFNFGSISANNQTARLDSGAVSVEDFDYAALRWDFGDAGREALAELAGRGGEVGNEAQLALDQTSPPNRWREGAPASQRQANLRVKSDDPVWEKRIRAHFAELDWHCNNPCFAVDLGFNMDGQRSIKLIEQAGISDWLLERKNPEEVYEPSFFDPPRTAGPLREDSTVEVREWTGRQIYVDGEPMGDPFP